MRSRSLARVVIAGLGVSVVITLGCSKPKGGPSDIPGPQSASQRAALALFEAASVHMQVTASPLTWATFWGEVRWTNGPCEFEGSGQGSVQATLDGGVAPTSGTFLPTGSHTYVVSFSNCGVNAGEGPLLNGVASAAYNAADWSNVTATVSADSVRGQDLGVSGLNDVTADGSAVYTRVGSGSSPRTYTYTPATGSRLVNNLTTNVATFGGGAYSVILATDRVELRFDNLKVAINGTEYTLNGSLDSTTGSNRTHAGLVRITNNGTLVALISGDFLGNALSVQVLVPLGPF